MNKKLVIALCFVTAIAITSGYFLWQIDKHEKALIGQDWLNPIPYSVWQKYLTDKADYEATLARYKTNNTDILNDVQEYKSKYKGTLDDFLNQLSSFRRDFYLPKDAEAAYSVQKPDNYQRWKEIVNDLDKKKYNTPVPSNPPRQVILQSLHSLYRYLIAIDGTLFIAMIIFLLTYKEKNEERHKKERGD